MTVAVGGLVGELVGVLVGCGVEVDGGAGVLVGAAGKAVGGAGRPASLPQLFSSKLNSKTDTSQTKDGPVRFILPLPSNDKHGANLPGKPKKAGTVKRTDKQTPLETFQSIK